jgi:dephospho-CoA kinase
LEAIVHPLVLAALAAQAAQWRGAYGMFVVPLLLERGNVASRVDRVLVVDCPEQEQMRRVILRSKLAPEVVRAIMATQLPREARLARADDVIDNGGALEALAPQVERLHAQYLARARGALEAFAQSTDNGGQDRPAPRGGGPP